MALAPNPGSSPPRNGSRGEFHTPTRVRIRAFDSAGQTQSQIKRSMQAKHGVVISQSTISRILASSRNRRDQSGRIRRPRKLTDCSARYLARLATRGWVDRRLTYKQLIKRMGLNVLTRTVQRALKKLGYRRCVACSRPFINKAQRRKRLAWCLQHIYWTINNWARVIWSDEASFMTGERGRVFITRRKNKRYCADYIKSIYRSGRLSFMVWGVIGWGFKSKLVFLEKTAGARGINSKAYAEQVLQVNCHS